MSQPTKHHPVFEGISPWAGEIPKGFLVDFLGTITRYAFEKNMSSSYKTRSNQATRPNFPQFSEEYFEWIDLLESVRQAQKRFVFVELGAGYGLWTVRAFLAIKQLNPMPFHGIAVEAEPTHFEFLKQHCYDNDLNPSDYRLIRAAVWRRRGFKKFCIGDASGWYGQAIDQAKSIRALKTGALAFFHFVLYRLNLIRPSNRKCVIWVPSITLTKLLSGCQYVDLLDMDIQGEELDVVATGIRILNEKVRRIHIGTHNAVLEEGLRRIFSDNKWLNMWDYHCNNTEETPYGSISFQDGVQTWINQKF